MTKTSKTTEKKTKTVKAVKAVKQVEAAAKAVAVVEATPVAPKQKVVPAAAKTAVVVEAAPVAPKQKVAEAAVRLELVRPGAKSVAVAGSFNAWKPESTPLKQAGNGSWSGSLKVTPGRHEYLFVVDGQWLPDPNAKEVVTNPYGGCNSVLVVNG
jgi:1,4-alpha-glucan branching enzyme